jgi:hypothetical protein
MAVDSENPNGQPEQNTNKPEAQPNPEGKPRVEYEETVTDLKELAGDFKEAPFTRVVKKLEKMKDGEVAGSEEDIQAAIDRIDDDIMALEDLERERLIAEATPKKRSDVSQDALLVDIERTIESPNKTVLEHQGLQIARSQIKGGAVASSEDLASYQAEIDAASVRARGAANSPLPAGIGPHGTDSNAYYLDAMDARADRLDRISRHLSREVSEEGIDTAAESQEIATEAVQKLISETSGSREAALVYLGDIISGKIAKEDVDRTELIKALGQLGLVKGKEEGYLINPPAEFAAGTPGHIYYKETHQNMIDMSSVVEGWFRDFDSNEEQAPETGGTGDSLEDRISAEVSLREDLVRWQERIRTGEDAKEKKEKTSKKSEKAEEEDDPEEVRRTKDGTKVALEDDEELEETDQGEVTLPPDGKITFGNNETVVISSVDLIREDIARSQAEDLFRESINQYTQRRFIPGDGLFANAGNAVLNAFRMPFTREGRAVIAFNMGYTGYLRQMYSEFADQMQQSGNLGIDFGIDSFRWGALRTTGDLDEDSRQKTFRLLDSVAAEMEDNLADMADRGENVEIPGLDIASVINRELRGEFESREEFEAAVAEVVRDGIDRGLISGDHFGTEEAISDNIYATNLYQTAQGMKEQIYERIGRERYEAMTNEERQQYLSAVTDLSNVRIRFAQAQAGVQETRPDWMANRDGYLGAIDQMIVATRNRPILGAIFSPVVAGMLTSSVVRYAVVGSLVGGAAVASGGASMMFMPIIAGSVAGGGIAAAKTMARFKILRGVENRANARGLQGEGAQAADIRRFGWDTFARSGDELALRIRSGDQDAVYEAAALLEAERTLRTAGRPVDLVRSGQQEGADFKTTVLTRNELKMAMREYERNNPGAIDEARVDEAVANIVTGIRENDEGFETRRRVLGAQSFAFGAIAGAVSGIAAQEISQFASGLMGHDTANHITLLEYMAGQRPRLAQSAYYATPEGVRYQPGDTLTKVMTLPKSGEKVEMLYTLKGTGANAHWEMVPKSIPKGSGIKFEDGVLTHSYGGVKGSGHGGALEIVKNWPKIKDHIAEVDHVKTTRASWTKFAENSTPPRGNSYGPGYEAHSEGTELQMDFLRGKSGNIILSSKRMIGHTAFGPGYRRTIDPSTHDFAFTISVRDRANGQFQTILLESNSKGQVNVPEAARSLFKIRGGHVVPRKGVMVTFNEVLGHSGGKTRLAHLAADFREGQEAIPGIPPVTEKLTPPLPGIEFHPPIPPRLLYPPIAIPWSRELYIGPIRKPRPVPYSLSGGYGNLSEAEIAEIDKGFSQRRAAEFSPEERPGFSDAYDHFVNEYNNSPVEKTVLDRAEQIVRAEVEPTVNPEKGEAKAEKPKKPEVFICIPVVVDDISRIPDLLENYATQVDGDGKPMLDKFKIILHVNGVATGSDDLSSQFANAASLIADFEKSHPGMDIIPIYTRNTQASFDRYGMRYIRGLSYAVAMKMAKELGAGDDYDPLFISNDADTVGVPDRYVSSMIGSFEGPSGKEIDAVMGRLDWDTSEIIAAPSLALIGTRMLQFHWAYDDAVHGTGTTPGANTCFRASVYGGIGGLNIDGSQGPGGEDQEINWAIRAAGRRTKIVRGEADSIIVTDSRRSLAAAERGEPAFTQWGTVPFKAQEELRSQGQTGEVIARALESGIDFDFSKPEELERFRVSVEYVINSYIDHQVGSPDKDGFRSFVLKRCFGLKEGSDYHIESGKIILDKPGVEKTASGVIRVRKNAKLYSAKRVRRDDRKEAIEIERVEADFIETLTSRQTQEAHDTLRAIAENESLSSSQKRQVIQILIPQLSEFSLGKKKVKIEELTERQFGLLVAKLVRDLASQIDQKKIDELTKQVAA